MLHMAFLRGAFRFFYPSSMVSLGSLPTSFKLGYSFALRPSLFSLPWKSGFLSFGALRCNQMSRRLFDAAILPLSSCLVRGIDTLAGGDIGESVVARITLTLAVPSSLPKLQKINIQIVNLLASRIFQFLNFVYLRISRCICTSKRFIDNSKSFFSYILD